MKFAQIALISTLVWIVVRAYRDNSALSTQRGAYEKYYSSGGNAATPGYPDLSPSSTGRPPDGSTWDETQQAYVLRDFTGTVIGTYT